MLKPFFLSMAMIAGFVFVGVAGGVEVSGLYETEVGVASPEPVDRAPAFKRALARVLVKVTGDPRVASGAAGLLDNPRSYVQQFHYREVSDGKLPYVLAVKFDRDALTASLNERNVPVWGADRPAVLVWLAVEQGSERSLLGAGRGDLAHATVERVARARGIPVMLPLLDVEDRNRVSVADVAGGFSEPVRAASQRYQPDAVVIAQATALDADLWRGQWRLESAAEQFEWSTEGNSIDNMLSRGVNALADRLAQRLAVSTRAQPPLVQPTVVVQATAVAQPAVTAQPEVITKPTVIAQSTISTPAVTASTIAALAPQEEGILVTVEGVNSLDDYVRVDTHLRNMGAVDAIWPYSIDGDTVSFRVEPRGGPGDLEHAIDFGGVLRGISDPAAADVGPAQVLYFRLVR